MHHILRIVFCVLSISFLNGKPIGSPNTSTFYYDTDIIKDMLQDTKKLLDSSITCEKNSTFYSSDFTKECIDSSLNCTFIELVRARDECSESGHLEDVLDSLENLIESIESSEDSRGSKLSSECTCEKKAPENLKVFVENLRTGLQWLQS